MPNIYEIYQRQQAAKAKAAAPAGPNKYSTSNQQGQAAAGFAATGQKGFGALGAESADVRDQLRRQMSGQDSLAGEQLRQGLQQNLAAQSSMAASASPQNAAMAARTAMNNAGRLGAGMSGQQALAGIAERQAATQSLGGMLDNQRQMELQAALQSRGQSIDAYGNVLNAKVGLAGKPKGWERGLSAAVGAASLIPGVGRK